MLTSTVTSNGTPSARREGGNDDQQIAVASISSSSIRSNTVSENSGERGSCSTKTILLDEWQSAAEIYSKAVAELSRQIGILAKADYERLTEAAENARKRSLEAQANLEAHVDDHGCDGGEAAA
jgi:hypothetical protein